MILSHAGLSQRSERAIDVNKALGANVNSFINHQW
jgi:hypothetical protein